jgi:hypothetical protein
MLDIGMDYALKGVLFRFPSLGPEAELMCLGVFSRSLPATPGISQAMNTYSGPGLAEIPNIEIAVKNVVFSTRTTGPFSIRVQDISEYRHLPSGDL